MRTRQPVERLGRMSWIFGLSCVLAAALGGCGRGEGEEVNDMTSAAHVHHAIDYIEISVTDMAEAKRFYEAAFGWQFNDYGPEYAGIRKEGGEAGGLRLEAEVATGGPLVVLYSEDLEASLASVRAAGGRIVLEIFAFPGGRRFQLADPSGNELAVYAAE